MRQNENENFNKKKNNLILISKIKKKYKLINWSYGFKNAMQVIAYHAYFNTIFEMLTGLVFSENLCFHKELPEQFLENELALSNEELQRFSFYNKNISPEEYYNTLNISKIDYSIFVYSAFVYAITYFLNGMDREETRLLFTFSYKLTGIILSNSWLHDFIIEVLSCSKVFTCRLNEVTDGVYAYFSLLGPCNKDSQNEFFQDFLSKEKNVENLSFFLNMLSVNFFPNDFRNICINDCRYYKNLIPFFVALLIYRYNLNFITFDMFTEETQHFVKYKLISSDTIKKYQKMLLPASRANKEDF